MQLNAETEEWGRQIAAIPPGSILDSVKEAAMFRLQSIVEGLRTLFHKERVEREMDEELRAYLDAHVKEKMRSGMSYEQALRAARVEMGSMDAVKEEIHWPLWIDGLLRLAKNP